MNIALVDDDITELKHISYMIKKYLSDSANGLSNINSVNIDKFNNGNDFMSQWKTDSYNIIILDIYMDLSGIDIARKIRKTDKNVSIVFCSTSNEFASESYEVCADYFIQKPLNDKNITSMFDRINMQNNNKTQSLTLPDRQKIILHNIIYTEYFNHIVTIHTKQGENIQTRISQNELENILCKYSYFYSCYRGIVVNFHAVIKHNCDTFTMSNGRNIPISRRRKKEVREQYTKFLFEKMRTEVY